MIGTERVKQMHTYFLTSERMGFREMKSSDLPNLMTIFSDPIAMTYYQDTKTEQEALQWIQWTKQNYQVFQTGLWVVEDKQAGNFIGLCGLIPHKIDGQVEIEIGYLLKRSYWNQGLATEAAGACLKYGFDVLKFNRIVSLISPDNAPSIRVAQKIGMVREKMVIEHEKCVEMYGVNKK
ncbi:GNAT family N-acetyltransferase [Priestia koreensis]|uniref:GNAT family N-acetyltransferase n=3 Tax=Priestia koreensis TaxID=284581 RepID=UPI0028F7262D|nr:GNAT family N-acetyltransferase [Priestia koreensis]